MVIIFYTGAQTLHSSQTTSKNMFNVQFGRPPLHTHPLLYPCYTSLLGVPGFLIDLKLNLSILALRPNLCLTLTYFNLPASIQSWASYQNTVFNFNLLQPTSFYLDLGIILEHCLLTLPYFNLPASIQSCLYVLQKKFNHNHFSNPFNFFFTVSSYTQHKNILLLFNKT